MDVVVVAEIQKIFTSELGAIIRDDVVGNPKVVDDVGKKSTTCSDLMLVIGRASIHLENLSMATSKWVKPPVILFKGPTRSSPQTANGQVMGMVCRA
jgi:hypothetical protein